VPACPYDEGMMDTR